MRYEFDYYKAKDLRGESYLYTPHETLDGVKQDIDNSNEHAIQLGYTGSRWIITHTVATHYTDDLGMFIKKETVESAVEIYPEKL